MKFIPLRDPRVQILGRHDPDEKKRCLWWSGSGIRISLACSYLEAEITWTGTGFNPWIAVALDGAPICRFPLTAGTRRYPLLAGMDKTCPHRITVVRDSQPVEGSDAAPRGRSNTSWKSSSSCARSAWRIFPWRSDPFGAGRQKGTVNR